MNTFSLNICGEIIEDTKKLNKQLIQTCKEVRKENKSVKYSNEGYQSPKLNLNDYPIFLELYKKLKENVLFNLTVYDLVEANIDFTLPWVNINKPGDFNWPHKHLNSHFSAIYYLKVPKKSGDIVFLNPFNKSVFKHTPQESTFIMFPSNIEHAVERNESKQERISIAFDINLK